MADKTRRSSHVCDEFVLDNGVRVIAEYIPHFPSVSVGLWIGAGSMYETAEENGLSHFVEHMLFKSTQRRTTREIAVEMDAIGGQVNAFTAKECTCYYAKVIAEHLNRAMDLLTDLLLGAKLEEEEFEKERGVILEEIAMCEDTPEDLVYDLLAKAYFGDHSLSRPILGTHDQIASVTREALVAFRRKHYRPDNTVLAVAGQYDLDKLKEMAQRYLGAWRVDGVPQEPVASEGCEGQFIARKKDIEQVHMCLAYPGVAQYDDDLYPMSVMNNLFGGGMSSRLFQRIREESAMAYSVYSAPSAYPHCGDFTIYAAVSPRNVKTVLAQIDEETSLLVREGATQEEFDMAKAQLKGGFILGQESAYNRMNSMGSNMALMNRVITTDETIRRIEAVTPEDVRRVAAETLGGPRSQAFVGKKIAKYLK